MRLIDSHAHIYLDAFEEDLDAVLERAKETGLTQIYLPNIDHSSIDAMLELAEKEKGYCIPMMGLHPCSVDKNFEKELYLVEDWLSKHRDLFCAVGEMGTDLYWDKTFFPQQQEAFRIQCELAIRHELPIVIHCRESIDETIDMVKPYAEQGLSGVFHCFTGTVEQASTITEMGFKLGLGGVATFKNGGLEPVIESIGMEHILLETDSPYLAPTPHRGKRNEPAYVRLVAEKISKVSGKDVAEIGEIASANTIDLFQK